MPNDDPKSESRSRQVNQYDKILKENMEAVLPGLIANLLGIHVVYSEEIPDDIQHTKERKPDVLKKVTDEDGQTFILHIEFQVANEQKMVHRMIEYYNMLYWRYNIPVRQYVIYIGKDVMTMSRFFHTEYMNFHFSLINLSEVDYRLFLRSPNPEEKILALLGNYGSEDSLIVVQDIIRQVVRVSEGFQRLRLLKQLRVLGQLRIFGVEILNVMALTVESFWKQENDIFYQLGEAKGEAKGKEEVIRNLLSTGKFTVLEIASLAGVSNDFVEKVKSNLK